MNNESMTPQEKSKEKLTLREYLDLGEMWGYFFRKKDPNRPANFSLRMMHGINKISILIFLAGMIYLAAKHLF
jgi:hypothetical protein